MARFSGHQDCLPPRRLRACHQHEEDALSQPDTSGFDHLLSPWGREAVNPDAAIPAARETMRGGPDAINGRDEAFTRLAIYLKADNLRTSVAARTRRGR